MTGFPTKPLADQSRFVLVMGQSPPSSAYNRERRGLPFFQGKSDFGLRFPVPRVWCDEPARIAESKDVLISVRAPVGDANIAEHRACIGRGIAAVRACGDTDPDFLFFAMLHLKSTLASFGTGTTFESVNKSDVEALEVPYPDSNEQRAIAAVLSKVQEAVEVEGKLVSTTRELKQAALGQLFTRGLRGEPQKETEIGPVPESWEVTTIGQHCILSSGGTPDRRAPEFWANGKIPWVKTGEINYRPVASTEEHITELGLANSAAKLLPAGTLVMAMYGQGVTRGRVAVLTIEAATNQACAAIRPKTEHALSTEFLYQFLSHSYENIRALGHGANQKNLSLEIVRDLKIPLPTPDEQREIAAILRTIDDKIAFHEERQHLLRELFRTLLHDLMTGRRRVTADTGL